MGELGLKTSDLCLGVCFVFHMGGLEFYERTVDLFELLELFLEFVIIVSTHEKKALIFGEGSIIFGSHVFYERGGSVELGRRVGRRGGRMTLRIH